jgi:lipoate-protein ligase A
MAVDEAVLESVVHGESLPTLRLYAWSPPCLSLGYAQPVSDVDRATLKARGWDLVRRPTGGRAILHTDELTYSVCGPESDPRLAGGVLQSYRILAGALLSALHLLGMPAEAHEKMPAVAAVAGGAAEQNPVCFEVPSNYEITVGGKKLIGSAQRRSQGGVLQHGSLPLYGDLTRITQGLVFDSPEQQAAAAERLLQRAVTSEAVLGRPLAWEEATEAMRKAFEDVLNLDLQPSELTPPEVQRAERLVEEKYAHSEWNTRI